MSPVSFEPPPAKPVSVGTDAVGDERPSRSALPRSGRLPARVEQRRPVVRRRRRSVVGDVAVELEAGDIRVRARGERDHDERAWRSPPRRRRARARRAPKSDGRPCRATRAIAAACVLRLEHPEKRALGRFIRPRGSLRFPIPHISDFPLSGRLRSFSLPCRRASPCRDTQLYDSRRGRPKGMPFTGSLATPRSREYDHPEREVSTVVRARRKEGRLSPPLLVAARIVPRLAR